MKTKKNSKALTAIIVVLFVISMYINYGGQDISISKGINSFNSNDSGFEQVFVGYQEDISKNCYIAYKDKGDCRELKGDILITVVLVDDSKLQVAKDKRKHLSTRI